MDTKRLAQFRELLQTDQQPASISMLADEFTQYQKDIENSPATIKTRKTHIEQFARFCKDIGLTDISFLTNQFLDQYFAEYRKTHSEGTTNTDKHILKVFLTWVRDYKELPVRVHPDLIKAKKMKYKTPKAIDNPTIRQAILTADPQDKLIIALLAETGVRVSELTHILVEDIHGQFIDIHGKGAIDRTVTMTKCLSRAVRAYVERYHLYPHQFLFTNQLHYVGLPMRSDTVWRKVKKAFAMLGIECTPHMLRHSFAINLLNNGCDIMTIKDLLGHEYVTTTQQYLRLTDNQRRDNYNKHIGLSFYS